MTDRGLGVRDIAILAGVGPSTVMSWKSGANPSDLLAVKRLAEELRIDFCYLLTGGVEPQIGVRAVPQDLSELARGACPDQRTGTRVQPMAESKGMKDENKRQLRKEAALIVKDMLRNYSAEYRTRSHHSPESHDQEVAFEISQIAAVLSTVIDFLHDEP